MQGSSSALRRRWRGLARHLGATSTGADAILGMLVSRYTEPHRRYHTLHHVNDVLDGIDRLGGAGEPLEHPHATALAAWFHDVIYEPGDPHNVARSAQLATEALAGGGVDGAIVERTAALVLTTEHHIPDGPDAAVLCDADLAVLGRERRAYLRYARQIREEHEHLDDVAYRAGRREVLRSLLERPLPYHTATMREERGVRVRPNLLDELERLSDDGRPVGEALRDVAR